MSEYLIIGAAALSIGYLYLMSIIPKYVYEIYNEGGITKALNTKTGNVDFEGDPKTVIESATTIGKTLIKDGIYTTYNINLPSNTWLDGEGTNTILKCPNNTQENVISTFNKDNITLKSLTIDGNRFNNTRQPNTAKQNGMYFSGCTNLDIESCYVYRTIESGIQVTGRDGTPSSNIKLLYNTVYDTWAEGIVLFDGVSNIELKHNTSSNNGELANGGYSGITIMRNISNADIQYNTTFGNTIDGIAIDGDPGFENNNITVKNNISYSNTMAGIALHSTINSTVSYNQCYNNQLNGMFIGESTNNLIQYNKVYNNLHFGIATDTVHLPHYGGNTIDNNEVYGNGWDGIIVIRGDYNIISNNKVHDNVMSGILIEGLVQSEGTDATGRAKYTDVINNECWNNDYGIRERPLPNYVCQYNKFSNNNNYNNRIANELLEGTNHR